MTALDQLETGAAVRTAGHASFVAGARNHHGRWLLEIPDTRGDPASLNWVCGIQRQRLYQALDAAAADKAELITGAQVFNVDAGDPTGATARISWHKGGRDHTARADLIVAADGIGSTVRSELFPVFRLAYSGHTSWRAVITAAVGVDDRFVITWGPSTEFGALRISRQEVYWYGYFRYPADAPMSDELTAARQHFSRWPADVQRLVDATGAGQLIRHDVYHLATPLPCYARGRVVLIGDAAHPMLPTMGQGANTALEDAVCVGRIIAEPVHAGADLSDAITRFDRTRRPRTQAIARRSRLTQRIGADLRAGWQQVLRDAVLQLMPSAATAKAGSQVLRWNPPPTSPKPPKTCPKTDSGSPSQ
jgi:2-polyprenyl-6-methoxyphenol hydroxylase-like FAD-dependent oxidoreductase